MPAIPAPKGWIQGLEFTKENKQTQRSNSEEDNEVGKEKRRTEETRDKHVWKSQEVGWVHVLGNELAHTLF